VFKYESYATGNKMEKTIESIKGLIPVIAAIVAIAGFYFTTQHRLEHVEEKIEELQEQDKKLKKMMQRKAK
tara:strand:- start:818 stop:1030 length:213 start_codon:yes stop_codon:yes gene_type:complete